MSAANAEPAWGALQHTATNKAPKTNSSEPNVSITKSHQEHIVTPNGFEKATPKDINVEYSKLRRRFMLTCKRDKNGGITDQEQQVRVLGNDVAHGASCIWDAEICVSTEPESIRKACQEQFMKLYLVSPTEALEISDQRVISALDRHSTAVSHTFKDAHPELLTAFKVFFDLLQKDGLFKPLRPGTEAHAAYTAVMQKKMYK
ncbi:uncharacterized protein BDV14DRAFT_198755 [Aspergillus stella-maris]|uniref:uncharacterized protein n=1 Tax=Aspergillus stella-maris TaxID=1810926 RepID=UPI003CCD518D